MIVWTDGDLMLAAETSLWRHIRQGQVNNFVYPVWMQ